jgi:hypothetical protein
LLFSRRPATAGGKQRLVDAMRQCVEDITTLMRAA